MTVWILGGVGITLLNTSLLLSEQSSPSIAYLHLIQSECCLYSAMVEKHELTIIVLQSYNSPELV
jgi:hypothetical protein